MASLNNFTCGFSPITDTGPECGGNGVCTFIPTLNRGVCICNSGWQGESDYQVSNSFLDCQINVVAIRALWCIVLIFQMVFTVFIVRPRLRWLWVKHQGVVEKHQASGKKYHLWENKGLFSMMPFLTLGWAAQLAYTIIKIVDQNYKIGSSVLVTILYILWRLTFIFCPDTFQPALLASLLKSERNLDHIIVVNRRLSTVHMIVFMSSSILAIIPLVVDQSVLEPIVGVTSFVLFTAIMALSMLALALQAFYVEKRVQAILASSFAISKDARTAKVMTKMAGNQRSAIKGGLLQFVVYGFFTCFPYMWNKHDYLLPITWILGNIQIKQVMDSLIQVDGSTNQSSTADRKASQPLAPISAGLSSIEADMEGKEKRIYGLSLDPVASKGSEN